MHVYIYIYIYIFSHWYMYMCILTLVMSASLSTKMWHTPSAWPRTAKIFLSYFSLCCIHINAHV